MSLKRIILEMGSGSDLHGEDYTKAAIRAVQDALYHSSLTLFRTLDIDPKGMSVEVTIGAQKPDAVDRDAVKALVPYGTVKVNAVTGGLDIPDPDGDMVIVTVTAAVAARVELPEGRYRTER